MDIEVLTKQNPWWKGKELIEMDEEYKRWKSNKIKWTPHLLSRIPLQPFALNFIFGPRQVGKTTFLKLLIKKLLEDGIKPERIFYFKCDKISNFKELDDVIKTYFEFRKESGIKGSIILLDEITFPEEWFRTIKFYIDLGDFKEDVLILTGSLSMYLKKEVELFPGRRGNGRDYIMAPLTFREFVEVVSPELYAKIPAFKSLESEEVLKKILQIIPFIGELNDLFKKYIRCGGFPLAINSFLTEGKITEEVKESYWSWLKTDLFKIKRSEEIFKRVAKAILEKTPSALSLNSIAKEFEVGTHKTVQEYLYVMSELFVSKTIYFVEPNKAIANFRKNRKIHYTDPFFFYLFSELCFSKLPEESAIIESIVTTHLARKYNVFWWSNRSEIDAVAQEKNKLFGFEIKWEEKVRPKTVIVGKIKQFITLSKKDYNKIPAVIPICAFLAALKI